MMIRSLQSHLEKAANAFFSSNQETKIESLLLSLLILFIPTELGKHFWPDFSVISGIRVDYLSPTFYFTDATVLLLLSTWCVRKIQNAKSKGQKFSVKLKNFTGRLIAAAAVFLLINISSSGNLLNGYYHLLKLLEFIFVGWYVAANVRQKIQIARVVGLLSIGVICESFLAIWQFINQGSIGGIFYFFGERMFSGMTPGIANASINGSLLLRPYGTFSHPNVLAGYLLCSMVLILFVSRNVLLEKIFLPFFNISYRFFTRAALLLGTSGLLLSMSRVAIVIWLAFLFILFLSQVKTLFLRQSKLWIASFIVVISLLVAGFLNTPIAQRLAQSSFSEEAVVERVALSQASVALFYLHPFLGVGFGNFLPSLVTVQKPLAGAAYLQPVHNIFLFLLVETGLVGLGLFLFFLGKTYKQLLSTIQQDEEAHSLHRAFLVTLTVALILGSADHYFLTLQQGQLFLSLLIGMCWAKLK